VFTHILSQSAFAAVIDAPIEQVDLASWLVSSPEAQYQRYSGEIAEKHHCRMVSCSDVYTSQRRTTVQIIRDMRVERLDDRRCEYINSVTGLATPDFLSFIEERGITLEQAAAAGQAASVDRNRRQTLVFARSIERSAAAKAAYGFEPERRVCARVLSADAERFARHSFGAR